MASSGGPEVRTGEEDAQAPDSLIGQVVAGRYPVERLLALDRTHLAPWEPPRPTDFATANWTAFTSN